MDKPAVRDATLLIVRVVLGVVFIAHGLDKAVFTGLTETTGQFSALGVAQPKLSAYLSTGVELLGGALLVIGLLTTAVAGILMLLVAAALWFVHLDQGFFSGDGGVEFPVVLLVTLLVVVVFGSGRASVDWMLTRD